MNEKQFLRGFLPDEDPQQTLPEACNDWVALGADLRKLVLTRHLRPMVRDLPPFPAESLATEREKWRAINLLGYINSLYVLGSHDEPVSTIPANLAVPFHALASEMGVPPILSYAIQALYNWRRIDPAGPITAENLTLLQNFAGGMDEEWFVTLHIEIEAAAAPAILALQPLKQAAEAQDFGTMTHHLETIGNALETMTTILKRMPERCDPYIYYNRVRPFMFGWKDNEMFPEGVLYEGVEAYGGKPIQLRGETGAQSSVVPAIDATLGIGHERDEMRIYLIEMFDYMPIADRNMIFELQKGAGVRQTVIGSGSPSLRDSYNFAIEKLSDFRIKHIEYAAMYILKPAQSTNESAGVGTGGTQFTFYLKKHINETKKHLID